MVEVDRIAQSEFLTRIIHTRCILVQRRGSEHGCEKDLATLTGLPVELTEGIDLTSYAFGDQFATHCGYEIWRRSNPIKSSRDQARIHHDFQIRQ
jgi:hypothetical protein